MESEKPASQLCVNCRSPKAPLSCPLCEESLCSKCAEHPPQGAFRLLIPLPTELSHPHYCPPCYANRIEPELEKYVETLEQAKQVFVFYVTQRKAIPLIRKARETIRVSDQADRDDTILALAYKAVERGFNALIECDVKSVKVRNEGWQHSVWNGTAIPAQIDADKMDRY